MAPGTERVRGAYRVVKTLYYQTDTTRMSRPASAAFVLLRAATHTLFYINSRCKQARQFSDDHSIVWIKCHPSTSFS